MRIRCIMQPKTVLAFPPLATSVGATKRKTTKFAKLRERKLKGAAFALSRCQGDRILANRQDFVQYVILDTPLRSPDTSQELNARPDEHVLSHTGLPWLDLAADEDRRNVRGQNFFVQLSVEFPAVQMGDDEIVAGWTFEPTEGPSSLEHLGQRLQESLASRN